GRDLPRHDSQDGAVGKDPLRGRRLRRLRPADDRRAPRRRAHRRGRRRQDLRRPARAGRAHPNGRDGRWRGDTGRRMIAALLPAGISAGDTAWMLTATALVLMMTPALGLFYAGLVRAKNALNTFMMTIAALGVVTVTWAVVGYSFAFDKGNGLIGGFHYAFLHNVTFDPRPGTAIPGLLF